MSDKKFRVFHMSIDKMENVNSKVHVVESDNASIFPAPQWISVIELDAAMELKTLVTEYIELAAKHSREASVLSAKLVTVHLHSCELERKLEIAKKALEKISDPRKRDHREPDAYTELGCVMHIAEEALKEIE